MMFVTSKLFTSLILRYYLTEIVTPTSEASTTTSANANTDGGEHYLGTTPVTPSETTMVQPATTYGNSVRGEESLGTAIARSTNRNEQIGETTPAASTTRNTQPKPTISPTTTTKRPTIPPTEQARVDVSIKLTGQNYTNDLDDKTSEAYNNLKMEVVITVPYVNNSALVWCL